MGIETEIQKANPTIEGIRRIVRGVKIYEKEYKINLKRMLAGKDHLGMGDPPDNSVGKHQKLLDELKNLEKSVNYSEELQAMHILVERIGNFPRLFNYENKSKETKEKFKKKEKTYEDKYADKKTRRLIKVAKQLEENKIFKSKEKIKNTKFKGYIELLGEDARGMSYHELEEREKIYTRNYEAISSSDYEKMINSLVEEMTQFNKFGKGYMFFDMYPIYDDEKNHDSRIEKAMSLSDKDEKTLESIFDIYIPSDIREEFTERDLKAFDAYSKKMREAVKKVKEFDVEMEEYQLAEERSETALDELAGMYSIQDKMKAKIRNSIKAHKTKLAKSRRKIEEKKEKYEEKTGIKKELGRVGHYQKLLELHNKYADITITEEKLLAEADCSIRIDEAKKELEEMKRKAPSEERDQEIEKIESRISWDKARLKEFKEEREGVAEYKGLMKGFVEDTIARARGKDKVTTKALPVGNVEAKENDSKQEEKQEEKPNYQVLRDSISNSRTRYPNAPKREGKTNGDVKNKDNDKHSKSDVGEIE